MIGVATRLPLLHIAKLLPYTIVNNGKGINQTNSSYIFPKQYKKGRAKMREKMTNLLSLPKEVALNLPLILATGRGEVSIENYKNLIEFTETKIRINTSAGALTIEGERLNLKQITTEHILITGKIAKMNW